MIKFKGTVNGVEFDNVKDYNEAVTKAIESGKPFTANSQTYAEECSCKQCNCKNKGVTMTLPNVDLDRVQDDDYYANMKDMLDSTSTFENYSEHIKSFDDEEVNDFLVEADKCTTKLIHDSEVTTKAIDKITAEMEAHEEALEKLEKKLSVLGRAETLIYKSLDVIDGLVTIACEDKSEPTCECREVKEQKESPSYEINGGEADQLVSGFTKFLDAILGK